MKFKFIKKYLVLELILSLVLCSFNYTVIFAANSVIIPPISSDTKDLSCTEVKDLPDGGKLYIYNVDGVENVYPVPPANFDPVNASDESLKIYGLPERPKDKAALENWKKDVTCFKNASEPDISEKISNTTTSSMLQLLDTASSSTLNVNATSNSTNWSGYADTASTNTWASIQGDFTQPTKNDSSSSTYESTWIGLGGYNDTKLAQAGTAMDSSGYVAWYEYLGPNGQGVAQINMDSVPISPGDKIHVYVSFESSNNKLNCYIANNTQGKSQSVYVTISSASYYSGKSCEWIDERPTINGSTSSLANYGSVNWTNCQAYTKSGNWVTLGSQSYTKITMINSSGTVLSQPGSLSSDTSFTDTWKKSN